MSKIDLSPEALQKVKDSIQYMTVPCLFFKVNDVLAWLDEITILRSEIKKLEKEVDWLANKCVEACKCARDDCNLPFDFTKKETFRNAAKYSVAKEEKRNALV